MFFGVAVKAFFWAFALELFYLTLALFSNARISSETFSLLGFMGCYFLAFVCVWSVNLNSKKPANA